MPYSSLESLILILPRKEQDPEVRASAWRVSSVYRILVSAPPQPPSNLLVSDLLSPKAVHLHCLLQCCGSATFWYGSGSADPYLWLTHPDLALDSATFVSNFSRRQQKLFFFLHFHHFLKIKSHKKVTKQ